MVHPDTYTAVTNLRISLFASRDFKKGEILWIADKKTDRILSAFEYSSLNASQKERIAHMGYIDVTGRFIIPGDNGLYVNHSCNANCTYLLEFDNISIVNRDIKRGEQITENYLGYYRHSESFQCKCGSENCIGQLSISDAYRPILRKGLKEISSDILNQVQPLLAIDFEHKKQFIRTLINNYYGTQ